MELHSSAREEYALKALEFVLAWCHPAVGYFVTYHPCSRAGLCWMAPHLPYLQVHLTDSTRISVEGLDTNVEESEGGNCQWSTTEPCDGKETKFCNNRFFTLTD
ncbi:hypothetical protein ACLOJK_025981 [Asimina triloba]